VVDLYKKRQSLKSELNGTIVIYEEEGARRLLLFLSSIPYLAYIMKRMWQ
jgi:hypothetical protein